MNLPDCPRCGAENASPDGDTPCEACRQEERERKVYELEHLSLQIAIREENPEPSSK